MRVDLDFPWPVTAGEIRTLNRLIKEGRIKHGDSFTPSEFAKLVGCDHLGGERACANCLGDD